MASNRPNRPIRLATFDYRGFHRYHVRTSTWRDAPAFATAPIACLTRSQMFHSAALANMEVDAYCFMPDHAHVLVRGTTACSLLGDFVSDWKQRSAHAVRARYGVRLWRPGYFDRILREDECSIGVARYILENPVRAGLARTAGAYPWAWCR
jgi:putative transposase